MTTKDIDALYNDLKDHLAARQHMVGCLATHGGTCTDGYSHARVGPPPIEPRTVMALIDAYRERHVAEHG